MCMSLHREVPLYVSMYMHIHLYSDTYTCVGSYEYGVDSHVTCITVYDAVYGNNRHSEF